MNNGDFLELLKIAIIIIIGFIIIKGLLSISNSDEIKYACDCCKDSVIRINLR